MEIFLSNYTNDIIGSCELQILLWNINLNGSQMYACNFPIIEGRYGK